MDVAGTKTLGNDQPPPPVETLLGGILHDDEPSKVRLVLSRCEALPPHHSQRSHQTFTLLLQPSQSAGREER